MEQNPDTPQILTDRMDAARANALHVALDLPGRAPDAGDRLPSFWHQLYFWDVQPSEQLGPDGHPKPGNGLIPDLGNTQRMWAGGDLTFHRPIRLGDPATKTSTVTSITRKRGRSGPLIFATLTHQISQHGQLCVTEVQDLVYRQPGSHSTAPKPARTDEGSSQKIHFTTTQLFRYSALTMNGHRIHYDADYARDTEGYTGLVVHGPLLAQLLIGFAERQLGRLTTFQFRAISPLMQTEPAALCIRGTDLWVRAGNGRICMQATAT